MIMSLKPAMSSPLLMPQTWGGLTPSSLQPLQISLEKSLLLVQKHQSLMSLE